MYRKKVSSSVRHQWRQGQLIIILLYFVICCNAVINDNIYHDTAFLISFLDGAVFLAVE